MPLNSNWLMSSVLVKSPVGKDLERLLHVTAVTWLERPLKGPKKPSLLLIPRITPGIKVGWQGIPFTGIPLHIFPPGFAFWL